MNKIFISQIKKILVFILIISIVAPSVFLYQPKKAGAIFGIGGDEAEIASWVKEYILDPLAYAFINALTAEMTRHAVNWIKGNNFRGPSGGSVPGYATNVEDFFKKVGDRTLGTFIEKNIPLLCGPFQADISVYLNTKYKSTAQNDYCTFTEVGENVGNAYNKFMGNFNNGGWKRWIDMTINPINNRYGAAVFAEAGAGVNIGGARGSEELKLNWGKGFLSWEKEVPGKCRVWAVPSIATNDDGTTNWDASMWAYPDTGLFFAWMEEDSDINDAPCIDGEPSTTKIKTPGSFLEKGLSDVIGLSGDRLSLGDEIDEIIGALITKLISIGFDALGLGSADTGGSEDSVNKAKRRVASIIEDMTESVREYIDIKKRSLQEVGNFPVDTSEAFSDQIEKEIDWYGNEFDWDFEKYYTEDRSTKTDWTGNPFNWTVNKYYNKNSSGGIAEENCQIAEDVGAVSYIVTLDSDNRPTSFWSRSECTGSGNNISWGAPQGLVGGGGTSVNSFKMRAVDGVCGSNNYRGFGYIVKSSNSDSWSRSECSRNEGGLYYWSDPILMDALPTRAEKIINSFKKKIDWNGVFYEWPEDGLAITKRKYYQTPGKLRIFWGHELYKWLGWKDSFGPSYDDVVNNKYLRIEDLENAICYRSSETAKSVQEIFAVKIGEESWTALKCTNSPRSDELEMKIKRFLTNYEFYKNKTEKEIEDTDISESKFGVWSKLSVNLPAYETISLEGGNFQDLLDNYGKQDVVETFENLLACLTNETDKENITNKIEERKSKRLRLVIEILIAEKMMDDIEYLVDYSNNSVIEYNYFLKEMAKIQKSVGFSDEQIAEAQDELDEIMRENESIESRKKGCVGEYENDAEAYKHGYSLGYGEGYEAGYDDGYYGETDARDNLPHNTERVGYTNGYNNGYYDGYSDGFDEGVSDFDRDDDR